MASGGTAAAYSLLRQSCRALNRTKGKFNSPSWRYVRSQASVLQPGEAAHHMPALQQFIFYIDSTRQQKILLFKYQGRGERSVKEAANLVGLQLPELTDHDK